jgi:SAM-dependent methyltransferase
VIETWSQGIADDHMDEAILVELATQVKRHPWWRARTRLALSIIQRAGFAPGTTVLESGCGWGTNLEALEDAGYPVVGLDVSQRALARLDRPGRRLILADLTKPLGQRERFDVVLALDVLEHLDDDDTAFANLAQLTAPGGLLVVSVPARPSLFSRFDEIQGHRRRYLPRRLEALTARPELEAVDIFYWGMWMLPLLQLRKAFRAHRQASPQQEYRRFLAIPRAPLDLPLRLAYRLERRPAMAGLLPIGTSLFVTARRRP